VEGKWRTEKRKEERKKREEGEREGGAASVCRAWGRDRATKKKTKKTKGRREECVRVTGLGEKEREMERKDKVPCVIMRLIERGSCNLLLTNPVVTCGKLGFPFI